MGPKNVCAKDSSENDRMICMELEKEIIEKHDEGVRVVDMAKQYGRSTPAI